jgi:hypothetical protein
MLAYDAQEVALALCDSGVAIAKKARDLVNPTPRDPEQARKVLTANNILSPSLSRHSTIAM